MTALRQQLDAGLAALGIDLKDDCREALLKYLALLDRWNQAYNLTAIREPALMVSHHLLDSLAILPHLQGTSFIDVGTGAGLPGIPLALARPDWQLTLLDSNGKKTRFLKQAVAELGISNCTVVNERAEAFQPECLYDGVLSRAFTSLSGMVEATRHLLASDGHWYAMKATHYREELAALPEDVHLQQVESLGVPGVEGERYLLILSHL